LEHSSSGRLMWHASEDMPRRAALHRQMPWRSSSGKKICVDIWCLEGICPGTRRPNGICRGRCCPDATYIDIRRLEEICLHALHLVGPVVPRSQGRAREGKSRRVSETRSEKPRGTRSRATPKVSRPPQAGDLREERVGSPPVGRQPDQQGEIQDAGQAKPDGVVAGSSKRHASRFYQLKTGHCLTGQHLHRTKSRPTPQC
jgi:hypothetical protein